jgi:hypothetical protein
MDTFWLNSTTTGVNTYVALNDFGLSLPAGNDRLQQAITNLFSGFNSSPRISTQTIGGQAGLMGVGVSRIDGRVVYGAVAPIDLAANQTSRYLLFFLSTEDKMTALSILNSFRITHAGAHVFPVVQQQSTPAYTAAPVVQQAATGTRDDPFPVGTAVDLGNGWQITVLNVYPDATNMVLKENQFNKAPKYGDQFFLATVQVKYVGEGSSTFSSYDLRAVGPSSVGYSTFQNSAGVIPDPLPSSEVFTGGAVTGNVGWEISSSDANGLVMYYTPLIGGNSQGRMYMALYGPGSSSPATSYFGNEDWATKGTGKMGRGY